MKGNSDNVTLFLLENDKIHRVFI